MLTHTDPSIALLGLLFKLGWKPSPIGPDWAAECPDCGTILCISSMDLLTDLCWDHIRSAHRND